MTASRDYAKQRARSKEDVVRALRGDWTPRPQFADLSLSEEAKQVYEAIACLPPKQRQVMAWHYDGYQAGEIAKILGMSQELVRSHLRYARKRLKQLLSSRDDNLGPTSRGGAQ